MKFLPPLLLLLFAGVFTKTTGAPATLPVKAVDSIPAAAYSKIPLDANQVVYFKLCYHWHWCYV